MHSVAISGTIRLREPTLRSSLHQEVARNPLQFFFSPITDVTRAVVMPFKALFVVGLTGTINAMTYHGVWWVSKTQPQAAQVMAVLRAPPLARAASGDSTSRA